MEFMSNMRIFFTVDHEQSGFTLIELLVVIAIIGLLSSTVVISLQSVRKKAATQQFVSNLESIRDALEAYHTDYGEYPHEVYGSQGYGIVGITGPGYSPGDLQVLVDEGYLNSLPGVPNYFSSGFCYYFSNFDSQIDRYKCDGQKIPKNSNQEYYLQAQDTSAGGSLKIDPESLPDTISRATIDGTLYKEIPCFSSNE
jgi:type II secretion system protein G